MVKKKLITSENIKHVAHLSRLYIRKTEFSRFKSQLLDIFDYVNQIGKMDTKGIRNTSQVTGITNYFREDKIDRKKMFTQKQALKNAKSTYQGYFLVESVFKNK